MFGTEYYALRVTADRVREAERFWAKPQRVDARRPRQFGRLSTAVRIIVTGRPQAAPSYTWTTPTLR